MPCCCCCAAKELGGKQNFLFSRSAKSLASIDNSVSFKGSSNSFFKSYNQFEAISSLNRVSLTRFECGKPSNSLDFLLG